MKLTKIYSLVACCVVASVPAFGAFVEIGDAGNAADTNTDSDRLGRGSVGYVYSIGDTEVSYSEFNASPISGGTTPWTGANNPVTAVTRVMAAQYCNWLTSGDTTVGAYTISGGAITGVTSHDSTDIDMAALISVYNTVYVLPTEDEWYKAAYYDQVENKYWNFANGSDLKPSTAESRYNAASPLDVGTSALVEENGTKDMMGNVWEWLETEGTLRGGAYDNTDEANLRAANRLTGVADTEYDMVGFRMVAIPEPGTISFMSLSTIGLFLTRTVRRRKQLGASIIPVRRARACDVFEMPVHEEVMEEDDGLGEYVKAYAIEFKDAVRGGYEALNTSFWNHMVEVHERKTAKRAAFRQSFKKKAVDGFDAFLALIMK